MRNIHRIGVFVSALVIGPVVTATAAAASPGPGWVRPVDLGVAIPDAAGSADTSAPDLNLAIALFGIPVFQEGTAHVYSSFGSGFLAIAEGADSLAQTGGFLNNAIAIGDNSTAMAAGVGNTSVAIGDHATAEYGNFLSPIPFFGWPTGDNIFAFGDNSKAGIIGGSYNTAAVFGDGDTAVAGNGIFNSATVVGNHSTALAGEDPDVGNSGSFNLAAVNGDDLTANATGGIFKVDIEPLFTALGASTGSAAAGDLDGSWLADLLAGSLSWAAG